MWSRWVGLRVRLAIRVVVHGNARHGGIHAHATAVPVVAESDQSMTDCVKTQYDETTWSARTWMAFTTQRISVALHTAVAHEAALVYNARAHAVAGDPRNGGG